jgi:hypothetical protein
VGIRETLNENPKVTTGVTAAIVLIALVFIIYQLLPGRGVRIPTEAYYTVDDGATYFADDIQKIAPFDHDGKPAVRAYVFKCGDGKPFVAYLERYTPEAKKKAEQIRDQMKNADPNTPPPGPQYEEIMMTGVEVKKPGGKQWVRQMDYQRSQAVTSVTCPDGKTENLEPVLP